MRVPAAGYQRRLAHVPAGSLCSGRLEGLERFFSASCPPLAMSVPSVFAFPKPVPKRLPACLHLSASNTAPACVDETARRLARPGMARKGPSMVTRESGEGASPRAGEATIANPTFAIGSPSGPGRKPAVTVETPRRSLDVSLRRQLRNFEPVVGALPAARAPAAHVSAVMHTGPGRRGCPRLSVGTTAAAHAAKEARKLKQERALNSDPAGAQQPDNDFLQASSTVHFFLPDAGAEVLRAFRAQGLMNILEATGKTARRPPWTPAVMSIHSSRQRCHRPGSSGGEIALLHAMELAAAGGASPSQQAVLQCCCGCRHCSCAVHRPAVFRSCESDSLRQPV